jgi:Sulfotransferase domain
MAGIIWLASYPKSGNTWLRAFLHNLLRTTDRPYDINRLTDLTGGESQIGWYLQASGLAKGPIDDKTVQRLRPQVHRMIAGSSPDSVLLKTHNALLADDGFPLITLEVTAGAIYIVRNPLDVAISLAHHNASTIDEAIEVMALKHAHAIGNEVTVYELYDSWSAHVASWTAKPSPTLHVMRYEDMVVNPRRSFTAVTQFLGIPAPRERIEKAIRLSSFNVLKEQERRHGFRERPANVPSFFREGKVGQWKKGLSEAQTARIVAAHREQMARFDYLPPGM